MPARALHYVIEDLPRESLQDGLWQRTAIRGDDSLVTINWMDPGGLPSPQHAHPFDQLSFVLAGTMEFEVDGARYTVSEGEVLHIPADVPHTAIVVGRHRVLNVDVFAPVREDYLHLTEHQAAEFGEGAEA